MVRNSREIECNTRYKAIGGIRKEVIDMGKDLERDQDEAGTDGFAFTSIKPKLFSIYYEIDGLRERSKGTKSDKKDVFNRGHGREEEGLE